MVSRIDISMSLVSSEISLVLYFLRSAQVMLLARCFSSSPPLLRLVNQIYNWFRGFLLFRTASLQMSDESEKAPNCVTYESAQFSD
nr:MAG TPA: hypothetical protein [Caudoviricetes sp.]